MDKDSRLKRLFELVKAKDDNPKDFRFEYRKCCNLFPFNTRNPERPNFVNGFDGVVGAYTRCVCGIASDVNISLPSLINDISGKIQFSNDEDKKACIEIISKYISTVDGKLNIFSVPAYKYCLFSNVSQEKKGEASIGEYLFKLFGFPFNFIDKFCDSKSSNFFEELILSSMWIPTQVVTDEKITCKIPEIRDLFIEDMQVLLSNEEYFLASYPILLSYYYFYYISQLTILINKGIKGDVSLREKVYFLFDQEKVTKTKKASNQGYKMICECSRHLLANINVLAELNALFGTKDLLIPELIIEYRKMSEIEKSSLNDALDEWLVIVNTKFSKRAVENITIEDKIDYLLRLYKTEKSAFGEGTGSRYALWVEKSSKSYFTRTHGGSGTILNLSQDLLLLMLFVCKRGKRMKLKEFFSELERRGISLDSESKLAIENRLSDLNLLDKKSDSGEAAYV